MSEHILFFGGWYTLLLQGLFFFIVFYVIFYWVIYQLPMSCSFKDIFSMGLHIDFISVGIFFLQYCSTYIFLITGIIFFIIYCFHSFFIIYVYRQQLRWRQVVYYIHYFSRIVCLYRYSFLVVWTPKFNRSLYFKRK